MAATVHVDQLCQVLSHQERVQRGEAQTSLPSRTKAPRLLTLGLILASLAIGSAQAADEIHWTITGQTSVTFDWRGPESTIRYGLTTSYGQTVPAAAPGILPISSSGPFWEARLTGLRENTLYHYSIGNGADHTFFTAPPRGTSGFEVAVEGDIGDSTSYTNMPLVQQLIAQDPPKFVLMLGDLTYGNTHGQSHVDQHFNDVMIWSQEVAYMPIWGNHEWASGDDLSNYKGRFDLVNPQTSPGAPVLGCCGEDWYWFDYGNARFIAYPEAYSGAWSNWFTSVRAVMDAAQSDPLTRFIVTFGHRPAYSSGHHPGAASLAGYMTSLGASHSKYVLNLNGHSHNYERIHPQSGVVHITAGTGGSGLEQDGTCLYLTCTQPSWSAFRAMHLGVVRLRFTNTTIEGSFVCGPAGSGVNDISCSAGTIIDSFVIGAPSGTDTNRPTVLVTAPVAGSTVSGTISVTASASDNVGVAGVQFLLDGSPLGAEDVTFPSSVSWVTTGVANGTHTLTARARDAAGNTALSLAVAVTVSNTAGADLIEPTVFVTAPLGGSNVSGTIAVTAVASDNVGVAGVQFRLDSSPLRAEDTSAPYSVSWTTTGSTNGSHTLTATARDAAGNTATATPVSVTVNNPDSINPSVSVTAPTGGSTVRRTITVTASASDNVGIAGVQFLLDGLPLGAEDTSSPYSVAWDTSAARFGTHTLAARARDRAGNTTLASNISITVADQQPPVVAITEPKTGKRLGGDTTIKVTASDNVGVVGVRFFLDGQSIGAEDTTPQYELKWRTDKLTKGTHTFTASARDAAGSVTMSAPVVVRK